MKLAEIEGDPRCFQLLEDVFYTSKSGRVCAARAMQLDGMPWCGYNGASIPRLFWRLIGSPFTGLYRKAALFHDYFYQFHVDGCGGAITRIEADRMFLEMMKFLGVARWRRNLIYFGVRVGGWASW